jgi:hypothetical protein
LVLQSVYPIQFDLGFIDDEMFADEIRFCTGYTARLDAVRDAYAGPLHPRRGQGVVVPHSYTPCVNLRDGRLRVFTGERHLQSATAVVILGFAFENNIHLLPPLSNGRDSRRTARFPDRFHFWGHFANSLPHPACEGDRSAAYFCRYVARQVILQGLASRLEIQVAYAIGVAKPVSVKVETFGTGDAREAEEFVRTFDFRPAAMIEQLNLLRPIYRKTTNYGHFGKPDLPWEV